MSGWVSSLGPETHHRESRHLTNFAGVNTGIQLRVGEDVDTEVCSDGYGINMELHSWLLVVVVDSTK